MTTTERNVTGFSCYDERRIVLNYTGIGPLPTGERNKFFQPDGLIIRYVRSYGAQWYCLSAEIFGPRLGAGGKRMPTTAKLTWWITLGATPGIIPIPDWVQEFIDTYLPTD